MNLEIKQETLLNHLNYVIKGISTKNLIPILNCIKMELTKEGLILLSTNNDITIKTFIKATEIEKIKTPGKIVVYARYLYDIIKKLPNEIINVENILENKINIFTKKSSFSLNCNKIEDFPILNLTEITDPIKITQNCLKKLINQTIFATSLEEERPILTGLNLNIIENKLIATATDSYRLVSKEIKIKNTSKNNFNITIPQKNLLELNKILESNEELIELHIFNNKVIFKFENLIFMSSLINGTYPNTSALIPKENKFKIIVNKTNLYNSVDRASLLTNEYDKHIINLKLENKEMIISSKIPEIGKVEEKLTIINEQKQNINISFSSKYMLETLRTMEKEEIEIFFNGELAPIIFKEKNNEFLVNLILPIRT